MCTPRKPSNISGAFSALNSIINALTSPESSIVQLRDIAKHSRRATRVERRIDIENTDASAVARCAVPREPEAP